MPTPTSFTQVGLLVNGGVDDDPPTFAEPIQALHTSPEPEDDDSSRFRPLRLFATGGQGLVYVAHDKQLGREVALKELKPRNAERKISRHRFIREAEITGSLEHPGIVPVYSLGRHADGRPYYAMRLIQGRTMHDAIQQFYAPGLVATSIERNLLFRKLLQRLVNVCQTVGYAHSRGILHRDLKPANILLGQYGEALVADWGLARPFHPSNGCDLDPEFPVESDPGDPPSNTTMIGSALGTPAFMSPEQADGRWDKVGPASDVYSLGATLYTILTGQSPLPKMPWVESHRRITTGDIPSAKQLNPKAPRGLVAICRKAMALKMPDRYQSALSMAEDIEHWLADEPVSAEPAPLAERASRWMRRHRTLVWASAVLWLTVGVALAIGLVVVDGWRKSNDVAYQGRRNSMELIHAPIIDEWLGQQRELSSTQKQFLKRALSAYEALAAETGSDAATKLAVVKAYRRVGEIRYRLGQQVAASEAVAEADRRARLLQDSPDARHERALLYGTQGILAKAAKRPEAAEEYFGHAVTLFMALAKENPENKDITQALATGYNNRAATLSSLNQPDAAIEAFRTALQLRQELFDTDPTNKDAAMELARSQTNLGECLRVKGDKENAERLFLQAAEIAQKLVAEVPDHGTYREVLASAAQNLGRLYFRSRDKHHEAKRWLTISSDQYDKLKFVYANVPEYAVELASALNNLGNIALTDQNFPAAASHFSRAIEAVRPLEQRESTVRCDFVAKAVKAGLAQTLSLSGRHLEAVEAWKVAAAATPEKADLYQTQQALQLLQCNKIGDAISVTKAVVESKNRSDTAAYNCACIYSLAASRDATMFESHKVCAMALLQEIANKGYFKDPKNLTHLDNDADFKPIRDLPEYKAFREAIN